LAANKLFWSVVDYCVNSLSGSGVFAGVSRRYSQFDLNKPTPQSHHHNSTKFANSENHSMDGSNPADSGNRILFVSLALCFYI
jgi:hypothetical protein